MTVTNETIELDDGRVLDIFVGGAADGLPLVLHHGTPSDGSLYRDWDDDCGQRGLRLVAVSRPGYVTSTRLPGRDVAHAAADTAAVLDRLGLGEFATAGMSGGGPHALSCAALLPGRCRAAATMAGAGPSEAPGLDFTAGMGPENLEEFAAAAAGEEALRSWLADNAEPMRHVTGEQIIEAMGGLLPQVDKDALAAGYADSLAAVMRRALEPGFDGWVDDDLAFVRAWGFDLSTITVPVAVWQGELDLMVPVAHAPWLAAAIPGARLQVVPGHGHISLFTTYRGAVLDELLELAGSNR